MVRTFIALSLVLALAGCMPKGGQEYNQGVEEMQKKNFETARGHFEKAVAENPDFAEAWYNLGSVKERIARKAAADKKDEEAVKAFKSAFEDIKKAKSLMDGGKFVAYKESGEQTRLKDQLAKELEVRESILKLDDATIAEWIRNLRD
jgi:tetratricopeptide (TPR) repeat protein